MGWRASTRASGVPPIPLLGPSGVSAEASQGPPTSVSRAGPSGFTVSSACSGRWVSPISSRSHLRGRLFQTTSVGDGTLPGTGVGGVLGTEAGGPQARGRSSSGRKSRAASRTGQSPGRWVDSGGSSEMMKPRSRNGALSSENCHDRPRIPPGSPPSNRPSQDYFPGAACSLSFCLSLRTRARAG